MQRLAVVLVTVLALISLVRERSWRQAPEREGAEERAVVRPAARVGLDQRIVLVALPILLLVGGLFFVTVGAPALLAGQTPTVPQQPIAFDHRLHTQVVGLDCAFCHRTANEGVSAGLPDVQQCMGCHQVAGIGVPEIEKVRQAWSAQEPILWERINHLPDHVRFTHEPHIAAGVPCATCHGDVSQMQQVQPVRSLKMNDCVACHQQNSAPVQCSTCHY